MDEIARRIGDSLPPRTRRRTAVKLMAATWSVVLLTACSPKAAAPPPAMSQEEYRSAVTAAVVSLQTALEHLAKANAYKGLEDTVTEVATAAAQAGTDLAAVTPPSELATEHAELTSALQAFAVDVEGAASQVDDREVCTGATVRADVGDAEGTAALRDALSAIAEKQGEGQALKIPAAGQKVGSRPGNGAFLRAGNRDGNGELTIDNGGESDAVLTLAKKKKPAITVYVRTGKKFTVKGVPDGSYTIFFSGGAAWDAKAKSFGRDCAFQRFDGSARFRTTARGYTVYTLTLQPVAGGNASTTEVDPEEFPN